MGELDSLRIHRIGLVHRRGCAAKKTRCVFLMGLQKPFELFGLEASRRGGWVLIRVELTIGWHLVMPSSESTMKGGC